MNIRLGYVSISKTLDITASKTITYTEYQKHKDINKLNNIIIENLTNLEKIIDYNIKNNIHFYRLTSKLIPLASLKELDFDYIDNFKEYYQRIGNKIKKYNLRIDTHPGEFCVLNSTKKEIVESSIEILKYHYNILDALGIKNKIIILHIGSSVFGKDKSINRFINNFNKLPKYLQDCIALENDDKIYNIKDTLYLCEKLNIPMVLDYHHHICNNDNLNIDDYLERIFNTWKITPKLHFSSPKNNTKKDFRTHHDYINPLDFISFLEKIKHLNTNLDIMLECKAKDEALFKLVRQLKYYDYNFIDETTINLK
ncbi:MAG: UV DNA damage repair endonuclease UvsE [Bacilli bacterium]|nr:UV DNA damage repair endonuclease UvsE [Bacilli bacterium]